MLRPFYKATLGSMYRATCFYFFIFNSLDVYMATVESMYRATCMLCIGV